MPGMPALDEINSNVSDIFCLVIKTLLMEQRHQYLFVTHTAMSIVSRQWEEVITLRAISGPKRHAILGKVQRDFYLSKDG